MNSPATGIVDAHVHIYPAEVGRDPQAWAERMGEPHWGALVALHPDRKVRQGWADCDRLLRDMDDAGVERAILLGWYWERHETCIWHNRYYADCIRRYPDRLWAFATVQADAGAAAREEMLRAAGEGFVGLGEICPPAVGGRYLDDKWMRIWEQAVELGWPVNLHVTDPASRPYPGRVATPLEDLVSLASRLPELHLILAHWGGGLAFHEFNPYCRRVLKNAVYDVATSSLLYDTSVYPEVVKRIGANRILFGSDYPLVTRPGTDPEPGFQLALREIRQSGLPDSDLVKILGANVRQLIGSQKKAAHGGAA